MLKLFNGSMWEKIGVDAILIFESEGPFQDHKVEIGFNLIWLAITGQNPQQRRLDLLDNSVVFVS